MNQSGKILVLEDDERMRSVLEQVLSSEGHQVKAVGSALEAISSAAAEEFDLVIADIRMEGLDGLDAIERMKTSQPELATLVVTGYSTEQDSIRAIRLGVGDYLRKPFDFDELMLAVEKLLQRRRQAEQQRTQQQQLRRTLLRAVEAIAQALELTKAPGCPPDGLFALAESALRLAELLELAPEAAEELKLATLLAALSRIGVAPPFSLEDDTLPSTLARTLRYVNERWDGDGPEGLSGADIPLESRAVAFLLSQAYATAEEGALDPQLQELWDSPCVAAAAADSTSQGRNLLSLASAMEASQQNEQALRALELALAAGLSASDRVKAQFSLARLHLQKNDAEAARELLKEAAATSQRIGPWRAAESFLQAGILLGPGDAEGGQALLQAGRLYRDLGDNLHIGLVVLALHRFGHGCPEEAASGLARLGEVNQLETLQIHRSWLLPWLLEGEFAGLAAQNWWRRWLRDSQAYLHRLYRRGELSGRAVGSFLDQLSGPLQKEFQESLAADPDSRVRQRVQALAPMPAGAASVLKIQSFGNLEVTLGEERIAPGAWKSPKCKFIFAYLAAHSQRPVVEDILIDHFWGEEADKGKRNLYWCSSVIRGCLRRPGSPDPLLRKQGTLQLNPDIPRSHDLELLEDGLARARQASGPEALALLRRAVDFYSAPYLEGCYMDWALAIRDRTQEGVCQALLEISRQAFQAGLCEESLERGSAALELDRCRQEAVLLSMQSLLSLGRAEEATRLYERTVGFLAKDLDMEPGLPLLELHQRALLSLS